MSLSQTQSLFLSILADHLNGRTTTLPSEYDEAELLKYARQQQCEGIVYCQTHLPSLHQAFAITTYCSVNRQKLLQKIHDVFAERNIPYILFKGTEVARLYPVPALRTMGDSDILVRLEDKKRAHEALLSVGVQGNASQDGEWYYKCGNIHFELHHRLLYDEAVNLPKLKAWTDSVWEHSSTEDGIKYSIEPEYNLVYLLIHLRKHLMNRGVGFRQFMDITVTARQELDRDKVNGYLNELELTQFAVNCFSLCRRWFDVSLPMSAEISDEFLVTATEKIFAGGVFGFADENNKGNSINFQLQNRRRKDVFLGNIFMPYSHMRKLLGFSFLDGKPYLLPVAWAYRIVRIIKERRTKKAASNMFAPLTISNVKISEREIYLKQWGL